MEIHVTAFISLALAHFVALLSPGVDFFLILTNSSKYGLFGGIITSLGIAFANLIYILLALFGISLVKENELIFSSIKIIGSLYLLYISFLLLKTKKRELFFEKIENKKNKKDILKYFSMGFLSAILNPKNSIFYFTMFSISIYEGISFFIQSFYAIWMFFAVLIWDILVVFLVTNKNSKNYLKKYTYHIEKISAFVLLVIASSIIFNSF